MTFSKTGDDGIFVNLRTFTPVNNIKGERGRKNYRVKEIVKLDSVQVLRKREYETKR